ncbi:hypothetical protein [Pseudarthrobacter oxydans]|uniref:hypothetical protein n=1 Tax=Pseudarthrobacter oxydans TaxID=1671 RepID=UPI001571B2F5|nr:hypothetical protein [Pseudarthrobacter oxydans]MDV2977760.1 hypothetical protein [Actinomycetes bacterium ARC8]NSX35403.1 hypothetical protein [Pseudarthrobacter oxydans]
MQQPPRDTPSGQEPVSHAELDQTHEEILEYWTAERMAGAKPRELRLPAEGPRLKQRGADAGGQGSGTPE